MMQRDEKDKVQRSGNCFGDQNSKTTIKSHKNSLIDDFSFIFLVNLYFQVKPYSELCLRGAMVALMLKGNQNLHRRPNIFKNDGATTVFKIEMIQL